MIRFYLIFTYLLNEGFYDLGFMLHEETPQISSYHQLQTIHKKFQLSCIRSPAEMLSNMLFDHYFVYVSTDIPDESVIPALSKVPSDK